MRVSGEGGHRSERRGSHLIKRAALKKVERLSFYTTLMLLMLRAHTQRYTSTCQTHAKVARSSCEGEMRDRGGGGSSLFAFSGEDAR